MMALRVIPAVFGMCRKMIASLPARCRLRSTRAPLVPSVQLGPLDWLALFPYRDRTKRTKPPMKISVVTPSYNQGRWLEEAIQSVLGQGHPDLEYLVMDGGSSDESVEVIKRYEDRLAYWVSEPDGGQANAINL